MSGNQQAVLWPGWENVRLIGRGSFGSVYEIERKIFDNSEKAALKVISIPQNDSDIDDLYSDGYDDESITRTFKSHLQSILNEYAMMRKLNGSSNVVSCDDVRYVQHDDGIGWDVYIKMELLTPLTKAISADISDETVIHIAKDMCGALELCRKNGIIHRDIKPQNIFVSEHGNYKLGDFGIAKTIEKTMGGTRIGTYRYMAPEVYNNQPYGYGADIYSLGLVLYWLLNERRLPFLPLPPVTPTARQDEEAKDRRLAGEQLPAPVHGSEALKKIVLKACAYRQEDRYSSAGEMLQSLESLLYAEKFGQTINTEEMTQPTQESDLEPQQTGETEQTNETEQQVVLLPDFDAVKTVSRGTNVIWDPSVLMDGIEKLGAGTAVADEADNGTRKAAERKAPKKAIAILLAIFPYTGLFGVHDFYLGKKKSGIRKLFTINYVLLGWLLDIVLIIFRKYKTKDGEYL